MQYGILLDDCKIERELLVRLASVVFFLPEDLMMDMIVRSVLALVMVSRASCWFNVKSSWRSNKIVCTKGMQEECSFITATST